MMSYVVESAHNCGSFNALSKKLGIHRGVLRKRLLRDGKLYEVDKILKRNKETIKRMNAHNRQIRVKEYSRTYYEKYKHEIKLRRITRRNVC